MRSARGPSFEAESCLGFDPGTGGLLGARRRGPSVTRSRDAPPRGGTRSLSGRRRLSLARRELSGKPALPSRTGRPSRRLVRDVSRVERRRPLCFAWRSPMSADSRWLCPDGQRGAATQDAGLRVTRNSKAPEREVPRCASRRGVTQRLARATAWVTSRPAPVPAHAAHALRGRRAGGVQRGEAVKRRACTRRMAMSEGDTPAMREA